MWGSGWKNVFLLGPSVCFLGFLKVLALVAWRLDNIIHQIILIATQWITINKRNRAIQWIVIYSVDSVVHLLNNKGVSNNTSLICWKGWPFPTYVIYASDFIVERLLKWLSEGRLVTSLFKNAHILTLIFWVQLCHTQCMLVDKLLWKESARTIKTVLSLKESIKYL